MNKKQIKWFGVVIFIVVLLGMAFFVVSSFANSKWNKGLYLFKNQIAVSTTTSTFEFEIPAVFVGNENDDIFTLKEGTCVLSGNGENIPATVKLSSYSKSKHYFDVILLVSGEFKQGKHDFNNIEVTFGNIVASSDVSNIQIANYSNDSSSLIESNMVFSFRTDESIDFIVNIKNKGDRPVKLSSHENTIKGQETNFSIVKDITESGELNLSTSVVLKYPIEIQSKEDINIYISIPLYSSDVNTHMFFIPCFNAVYDEKFIKIVPQMQSNYPLMENTPDEILDIIN